jgi:hypothetical protein
MVGLQHVTKPFTMKKFIFFSFALLLPILIQAQDFPVQWKSKFGFKADRWFYDDNGKYVLGRTDEEAEVLDGSTGKSIWKLNFKTDLKAKTLERATYNITEGVVLFFNQDEKKKNGEKVIVDLPTGKELWRGDAYAGVDADGNYHFANSISSITSNGTTIVFNNTSKKFTGLDIRSGKVKWESRAFPDADLLKNVSISPIENSEYAQIFIVDEDIVKTQILYISIVTGEELKDDSRFTSKGGDYQKSAPGKVRIKKPMEGSSLSLVGTMKKIGFTIRYEMKATGDVNWSKEFESSAIRQIWNDAPYVKVDIQGDKIFVMDKQIMVFDLKTGNQLWKAPFDNCDASAGLKAKQEFGIAGWPLVSGNDVYYVDLRVDNVIKKVDGRTGKVLWNSEKFSSSDRIPNLILVDGVLVAQFGGMINTQIYIPASGNYTGGTYKTENRFDGKFGVKAYDAATGKTMWQTSALATKLGDKFSDRISAIYPVNNKIVVASDKNILSLEPKTGDLVYKTPLDKAKIGDIFEVLVAEDFETLYVFCDEGIASVNGNTGKLGYTTKTGEIFWKAPGTSSYKFDVGLNTFIWMDLDKFIGFDLTKGSIKGKMEDNNNPQLTADGNSIFVRDGDKVTRFGVNR